MTNTPFKITETGRYRLRNGDAIFVESIGDTRGRYLYAESKMFNWSVYGRRRADRETSFDIVEKLPDEGEPSVTEMLDMNCGITTTLEIKAPTEIASDGNEYPFEYWTTPQRFDEVTPPGAVNIILGDGRVMRRLSDDVLYCVPMGIGSSHEMLYDLQDTTWTIAPMPAKPKQESNAWDEYGDDNAFRPEFGEPIKRHHVSNNPSRHIAMIAWLQHILSKGD